MFSELERKFFGSVLKMYFICPEEWFGETFFKRKIYAVQFFLAPWATNVLVHWAKSFRQCCKNWTRRAQRNILGLKKNMSMFNPNWRNPRKIQLAGRMIFFVILFDGKELGGIWVAIFSVNRFSEMIDKEYNK